MSQDQKLPSNTDAPSLLSQLFQQETQVLDDSQGLAKFEGFRARERHTARVIAFLIHTPRAKAKAIAKQIRKCLRNG